MELAQLQTLLAGEDKTKIVTAITGTKSDDLGKNIQSYIDQYNPEKHDIVVDPENKRPDKTINSTKITYSRLPIPFQKLIVNRRAAFLAANPIVLDATPQDDSEKAFLKLIQKVWDDNKLDYDSKAVAKLMMSETEVAEIWYTEKVDGDYWKNTTIPNAQFTLRMRIIANSLGDALYPVFNSTLDMIAFGRGYKLKDDNGKDVEHFDIYTANNLYKGVAENNSWTFTPEVNIIGKIPVIYYSQPKPEWSDVQRLIDRLELSGSNHSDTNDRLGNPMLKVRGDVSGLEVGNGTVRVLQLKGQDADASIMAWDNAPASIELEQKNLRSWILDLTDTPDISFEQMKSIGQLSGRALRFMFLGAHLGASDKEEIFGKGIQRRINYIKAALVKIAQDLTKAASLSIKPKFTLYLPNDDAADVDMLITATQGGIMSKETAVRQNPLIENPDEELKLIKKDQETTPTTIDEEMNNNN